MRRSTVIAQCLVNSEMFKSLDQAELRVRLVFEDEFPHQNFDEWNRNMNDLAAADIIKNVGKASRINMKKFIEDLS